MNPAVIRMEIAIGIRISRNWMVKLRVFSDARLSDAAVAYNVRRSDIVKTFRRSKLVGSVGIKEQKPVVE